MFLGGILGLVGSGVHQFQIHLQGRIAQQTTQLRFRGNLGGHQIQQHNLQRTNVLGQRPVLRHNKNILLLQRFRCRQIVGDSDRHTAPPPF